MSDETAQEIDDLVDQAIGGDDDGDDDVSGAAARPRRVRKTGRTRKKAATNGEGGSAKTIEEMEVDELLPADLPKPGQNIKGLGDLYAKYGVGERPEFKVHLYRSYPKIGHGGVKFDGFYDEYDIPITEQQIQSDYGGGQYRIVVVGPHPTNPRLPKSYESHSIGLAGEPNWERMPRALATPKKESEISPNPPPLPMAPTENPKLAEAALKMFERVAESEREERRRVEAKADAIAANRGAGSDAVAEAERRRADDLIRAERERAESERTYLERRMNEMREQQESERRRLEQEFRARPSVGEELRALADTGLFNRDDGTAKAMLEQVLGKHRDEVAALNASHQEFVRSMREGHQREVEALRAAHQRELEAERQASRTREERIDERLRSERDERERDRQRHRESVEERDRHWKDRMEGALSVQQQSWEARHQMLISTHETTEAQLRQEVNRLRSEGYDLRQRVEDRGDIMTQLVKHQELARVMKELGGGDSAASSSGSSSGGIGLSGSASEEWKQTLAEGAIERAPQILEKLFGGSAPAAAAAAAATAPKKEYKEGEVVETPQGLMEVVRNPADGQLALAPKKELDEHRAAVAAMQQRQGGGGLLPATGSRSASRRKPNGQRRKSRSAGISAVPDLSKGLPKRRPPWEGGGDDDGGHAPPPVPPVPPPMPRAATRKPEPPSPTEPLELSAMERQALKLLAKEVHDSVQSADEPEEFVEKVLQKYPPQAIQQAVTSYTDRQIVQGIMQLEPNSAGATPAGRQFVIKAFRLLREAVS